MRSPHERHTTITKTVEVEVDSGGVGNVTAKTPSVDLPMPDGFDVAQLDPKPLENWRRTRPVAAYSWAQRHEDRQDRRNQEEVLCSESSYLAW